MREGEHPMMAGRGNDDQAILFMPGKLCFLGFDSVLRRAWQGSGGRRHVVGELVDTWESCGMLVGMCMWQYIGDSGYELGSTMN